MGCSGWAQQGRAGRVPVLGPEKSLLVGLRPDELVPPACGRDGTHTPSDSALQAGLGTPGLHLCQEGLGTNPLPDGFKSGMKEERVLGHTGKGFAE